MLCQALELKRQGDEVIISKEWNTKTLEWRMKAARENTPCDNQRDVRITGYRTEAMTKMIPITTQ